MHDATMVEYIFAGIFVSPIPIVMTLHMPAEEKEHSDGVRIQFEVAGPQRQELTLS